MGKSQSIRLSPGRDMKNVIRTLMCCPALLLSFFCVEASSLAKWCQQVAAVPEKFDAGMGSVVIVLRDLTLLENVSIQEVQLDGLVLSDGRSFAWKQIIAVEGAAEKQAEVDLNLQRIGQPWYLLQSRIDRGESYQVVEIATGLQQWYQENSAAGGVAISNILARSAWREGKGNLAYFHYFDAVNRLQKLKPQDLKNFDRWSERYLNKEFSALETAFGLSAEFPPFWATPASAVDFLRQLDQWEVQQQASQVGRLRRTLAIYRLCASIFSQDADRLKQADQKLRQVASSAGGGNRVAFDRLLSVSNRIENWSVSKSLATDREVQFGYRDLEIISNLDSATRWDAVGLQLYIEGVYLLKSADAASKIYGAMRLMKLSMHCHPQETGLPGLQVANGLNEGNGVLRGSADVSLRTFDTVAGQEWAAIGKYLVICWLKESDDQASAMNQASAMDQTSAMKLSQELQRHLYDTLGRRLLGERRR